MSAPAQTPVRATGRRDWLWRAATAILVPVLLLAALEGVLRVLDVGMPTGVTRACMVRGQAAVCDNLFFTATFFPKGMIRTPRPYAFAAEKPPGTFRIFVLGESAAYGDPEPAYGFSHYLEVMLRQRYPSVRFEVINTGITAINSHVLRLMAEELARYQPDLFVIYAGNNEVVGPYGPGTVLTSAALNLSAVRASISVRSTRTGQLLVSLARKEEKPQDWRGMEMFLSRQVPASSPLMPRVYKNFEANLRDMVRAARGSGARVLISTVGTNLRDCAPFASAHRADLGPDSLRRWSELVEEGSAREGAGDHAEALRLYQSASEIDGEYAELHYRIGRVMSALGDHAGARRQFVRAQELDTLRFRADSTINQVIRSVASTSGQGVSLVEAAEALTAESRDQIPGDDLFYEHVHMNPHGNYVIGRALFSQIVPMLTGPANGDGIPSQEDCERLLALTRYDRARVAGLVLQRMQRPPFTNQLDHHQRMQRLSLEAEAPVESIYETAAQYRWALAQNPDDTLLHLNYGLLLSRWDRNAALEQFRRARPYDDVPFVAPDGTVVR